MALSDKDKAAMKERIKALSRDEREALVEALEIKPDASVAEILKTVETLQKEVAELRKGSSGGEGKTILERVFGG
jgi:hypothetical protein